MSTTDNLFPNDNPERQLAEAFVTSNINSILYDHAQSNEDGSHGIKNLQSITQALQSLIDQTQTVITERFPASLLSRTKSDAEIVVMRKMLWLKFSPEDIRHLEESLNLSDATKAKVNRALVEGNLEMI